MAITVVDLDVAPDQHVVPDLDPPSAKRIEPLLMIDPEPMVTRTDGPLVWMWMWPSVRFAEGQNPSVDPPALTVPEPSRSTGEMIRGDFPVNDPVEIAR